MSDSETEQLNVTEMLAVQADALAKMKRNITNFTNEPAFSKGRLDRLNTRIKTYKAGYDDFMYHHRRLIMAANASDKRKEYFTANHIDEFENAYYDAVAAVQEQITKVTATTAQSVNDSAQNASFSLDHSTHSNGESDVRLPTLELPTFSGDELEWPSFADLFTASIGKCRTTDANKLLYLKRALRGKALNSVSELATTNGNFATAWQLLKQKYENKRILFVHAMSTVLNIETMKKETSSAHQDVLTKTDAAVTLMESIGIDKTVISSVLAFLIYQKLPLDTIGFVEQNVASHEEITSYEELKKILNIRIGSLEMVERRGPCMDSNNNSSTFSSKPSYTTKSINSSRKLNANHFSSSKSSQSINSGNSIVCKVCSEAHPVRLCGKFIAMTSKDRELTVERMRLCRNCLSSSHLIAMCKSTRNCRECGTRHHTLTHQHNNSSNSTSNATQSSSSEANTAAPQFSNTISGNTVMRSNHNRTLNMHSFRQVLLATAIVKVRAKTGEFIPLRALLDQGGDGCSITDAATQMLKLTPFNQRVEVKPMGGGPPIYANKVIELCIQSVYNDKFVATAPAVVMKTLTDMMPTNYVKVDKWPHIDGLQLADPEFFKTAKIDVILGGDLYWAVMLEGLRKGPYGTPMAQQTSNI